MDYNNYRGFNLNETAFPVQEYGFKVTMPFWRGENRTKSFQLTAGMVDAMAEGKKENLPILDFTTMKAFTCVIADFDELPEGYTDFNDFHYDLLRIAPQGCPVISASGKVKVIFLVEKKLHMDYLATVKELLPPNLHPYLDTSKSALTVTYINTLMCREIQTWLKTAIPQTPLLKSFTEIVCSELADKYVEAMTEMSDLLRPHFPKSEFRGMSVDRLDKLSIQLITSALDLCNEGAMWNQEIFATKLGLKSSRSAGKILVKLQELGFLEMVSNYSAGNKSRIFVCKGAVKVCLTKYGLNDTKTDTKSQDNINNFIAAINPPAFGEGNRFYLWISRTLVKSGLDTTSVCKILYDIDRRRPHSKQRSQKQLDDYAYWSEKKFGDSNYVL